MALQQRPSSQVGHLFDVEDWTTGDQSVLETGAPEIQVPEFFPRQCDGNIMSRYTTMTIGFLLVFIGIKFHLVESYLLTPRATKFWNSRIGGKIGSDTPIQDAFNNQLANNGSARNGFNQNVNGFNAIGGFNGGNSNNNSYSPYNANPYNPYSKGYMSNNAYGTPNNSLFQNASYQNANGYQQPFANRGYLNQVFGPQKQVTTPKWLGWPILFLGAVFILQGLAMKRT